MKKLANIFLIRTALVIMSLVLIGFVNSCDDLELPGEGSIPDLIPPEAAFAYASDPDSALLVQFTNLSVEAIAFQWDFGNGNTSTEQDPVFSFSELGTHPVSLTATDGLGVSNTITQDVVVEEGPFQPTILEPGFEDGMLEGGAGDGRDSWRTSLGGVIQITGSPVVSGSQGAKLTGDPNDQRVGYQEIQVGPDTQYDVSFIYTLVAAPAGYLTMDILDVSAWAADQGIEPDGDSFADNGGDHDSTRDYVIGSITVNDQDDPQEYLPASFSFNSGTSSVVAIYFYNLGSVEGRLDDVAINIGSGAAIPPAVSFTPEQSEENFLEYSFVNNTQNADTYEWDFGDGNTSTEANPTHVYETHDVYEVTLTATAANGLNSTFTTSVDIQAPVTADFTFAADPNDYRTIVFADSSQGAVSLLWEFGDGFQFVGDDPSHTYMDGTYEVVLTATSITGSTDVKTAMVTISSVFVPVVLEAGFEDNSLPDGSGDGRDSWRTPEGSDLGGVIQITSSPVASGGQAAKFPTSNDRAAYQEVTVLANTYYALNYSYTMKTDPAGSLTVSILDGPVTSTTEVAAATIATQTVNDQADAEAYVQESLTFFSGNSTTVVIYITNTDVEARVDDVSIMETEAPAPIVTNGDFEDSQNDWKHETFSGGNTNPFNSSSDGSWFDYNGVNQGAKTRGAKWTQSTSAAEFKSADTRYAYQPLTLDPNTTYVFEFEYAIKSDDATDPVGGRRVVGEILPGHFADGADGAASSEGGNALVTLVGTTAEGKFSDTIGSKLEGEFTTDGSGQVSIWLWAVTPVDAYIDNVKVYPK